MRPIRPFSSCTKLEVTFDVCVFLSLLFKTERKKKLNHRSILIVRFSPYCKVYAQEGSEGVTYMMNPMSQFGYGGGKNLFKSGEELHVHCTIVNVMFLDFEKITYKLRFL